MTDKKNDFILWLLESSLKSIHEEIDESFIYFDVQVSILVYLCDDYGVQRNPWKFLFIPMPQIYLHHLVPTFITIVSMRGQHFHIKNKHLSKKKILKYNLITVQGAFF